MNAVEAGLKSGLAHNLIFAPDNTYDIGASGATRPKDLYLAGGATISGGTGLLVTKASASGIIQVASAGGSGKTYQLVSDTSGTFTIGDAADSTPRISMSAANVIELLATAGVTVSAGFENNGYTSLGSSFANPAQLTGDVNDYNPTGLLTATRLRLSSDASRTITGLVAAAGRTLLLQNVGAQNIVLAHESGSSSAANRFQCPGAANFTLNTNDAVWVFYDAGPSRWYLATAA